MAAAANGNFVIAWEAIDPLAGDDASLDIYAKEYNAAPAAEPTAACTLATKTSSTTPPSTSCDGDDLFFAKLDSSALDVLSDKQPNESAH